MEHLQTHSSRICEASVCNHSSLPLAAKGQGRQFPRFGSGTLIHIRNHRAAKAFSGLQPADSDTPCNSAFTSSSVQ